MSPPRSSEAPLPDLVEESLDEAAFLWKRWEAELGSLTRNLDAVSIWTEDRLHGALDGVRVAGESMAERIVAPALAAGDPAVASVCAHLLAAGSSDAARDVLAAAIRESHGARLRALMRGIEVADLNGSFAPVASALLTSEPEHKAALSRLKAFRRAAQGRELTDLLQSNDARLQVEALHAAAYAQGDTLHAAVNAAIGSDRPEVRLAAIECGIRRRLPDAWSLAGEMARQRRPEAARFLAALAMLGGAGEHESVFAALREPALQTSGLHALGHIGTREAAETCIAGMRDPKLARAAGEAFCAITGAELERDQLVAAEPEAGGPPVPFEAEDLDAPLVPRPEELWPLPDANAVRRYWSEVQGGFARGTRYVRGQPASLPTLIDAVEQGPMLRRPDLILELAVRTSGKYDVEPRAFAQRQRRMMAAAR